MLVCSTSEKANALPLCLINVQITFLVIVPIRTLESLGSTIKSNRLVTVVVIKIISIIIKIIKVIIIYFSLLSLRFVA